MASYSETLEKVMKQKHWKAMFQTHILQRGRDYYEGDAVESLSQEGDRVQARVPEPYDVEIDLSGGEIQSWSCDCPYAEDGIPCKHLPIRLCRISS